MSRNTAANTGAIERKRCESNVCQAKANTVSFLLSLLNWMCINPIRLDNPLWFLCVFSVYRCLLHELDNYTAHNHRPNLIYWIEKWITAHFRSAIVWRYQFAKRMCWFGWGALVSFKLRVATIFECSSNRTAMWSMVNAISSSSR